MNDGKAPGSDSPGQILDRLYKVIESRKKADPSVSNTAKLFQKGTRKIAQKVGEEAVEVVIEAIREKRDRLIAESADLMYHLLVMWADAKIEPVEIWQELAQREGVSGIAEKQSRTNGEKSDKGDKSDKS
ncbi:MAG TPA: phosphoribosyl-ATP diphosphatase [Alphaproteobacteria bacterium]|nr:phosphoribosyl-ATP diphosphatase [Alphaproteobacteria bacterium]